MPKKTAWNVTIALCISFTVFDLLASYMGWSAPTPKWCLFICGSVATTSILKSTGVIKND